MARPRTSHDVTGDIVCSPTSAAASSAWILACILACARRRRQRQYPAQARQPVRVRDSVPRWEQERVLSCIAIRTTKRIFHEARAGMGRAVRARAFSSSSFRRALAGRCVANIINIITGASRWERQVEVAPEVAILRV